jgi:hypothetical protein
VPAGGPDGGESIGEDVATPVTPPATVAPVDPPPAVDPCASPELRSLGDGRVAQWRFDEGEGTNAADATGLGHKGAVVGATWIDDGVLGRALHFDGISYVQVARTQDLDIDGAITMIAWVRPSTLDELQLTILSKAVSSTTGYDLGIHTYDLLFGRVGGADGAGRTLAKNGGMVLGQWQQVVVTYDGTTGSLYYNGVLAHSKAIGGPNGIVASDLMIGKPADRSSLFFMGDIDEVEILNVALDAAQVAAYYRCVASRSPFTLPDVNVPPPVEPPAGPPGPVLPLPISTDGLVAYYAMSMSGRDESGRGNDAEVKGAIPVSDRFGNADAAYLFDGVDDALVCARPAGLPSGTAARTIAGWFWSDKLQQYAASLFGYGGASYGANFQLTIGPQSLTDYPVVFRVNGWGDSSDWRSGVAPAPLLDQRWHHAAVTYDGSKVALYIDGALQASATWAYQTSPAAITLGAETGTGGTPWKGALDDVVIFSRVLSSDEIKTLAAN